MAKKSVLRTDVHVTSDSGESKVLKAGSEVPKWASKLVTNPKAFLEIEDAPTGEPDGSGASGDGGSGQQPPANTYVAKRAGVDDVPPYADWAFHDLQAEAGANGRALDGGGTGKADEIVARLTADDAAQAPQ